MTNVHNIKEQIIEAASSLGVNICSDNIRVVDRGMPHKPTSLPKDEMGIYMFEYESAFLKIGKVGAKSNARFLSQHYNPRSSMSNLAISILGDELMTPFHLTESNVGDWIKTNTRRIDILVDVELGMHVLNFIEAALLMKYNPRYEGFLSQR